MKSFSILESTIIGFFVGVVVSTYLVFITSTGAFVGQIIDWISMGPIVKLIHFPDNFELVYLFVFYVVIYTIYGFIIGLLIKDSKKTTIIVSMILLGLFSASVYEQLNGVAPMIAESEIYQPPVAAIIRAIPKENEPEQPKQFFGNEVTGDLDGDGIDDVAFLITRNDKDRGMLYYLSTALSTSTGHIGTNLIYLGERFEPQRIYIDNGIIGFEYIDVTTKKTKDNSTTTPKTIFAQVKNGILEQIEVKK